MCESVCMYFMCVFVILGCWFFFGVCINFLFLCIVNMQIWTKFNKQTVEKIEGINKTR